MSIDNSLVMIDHVVINLMSIIVVYTIEIEKETNSFLNIHRLYTINFLHFDVGEYLVV
jgi:hypothetical protein